MIFVVVSTAVESRSRTIRPYATDMVGAEKKSISQLLSLSLLLTRRPPQKPLRMCQTQVSCRTIRLSVCDKSSDAIRVVFCLPSDSTMVSLFCARKRARRPLICCAPLYPILNPSLTCLRVDTHLETRSHCTARIE